MRRLAALILVGSALVAGCSDKSFEQPGGPSAGPNLSVTTTAVCDPDPLQTALRIEGLIDDLFDGGNQNAALQRWGQVEELITAPPPHDLAAVRTNTYSLVDYALGKYNQGQLNDVAAPGGTAQALTDLLNLMLCYTGIGGVVNPIGDDGAAALYQPGSPPLTLIAPSGYAGISLPAGTGNVTLPTVISLSRVPGPLLTGLDQYPLYYEFNTSSGETFLQDATVAVCTAENVTVPDETRLRLAHNVPEPNFTTIEILPIGVGFLDCTGAQATSPSLGSRGSGPGSFALRAIDGLANRVFQVLQPDPLSATALVTGVTGTTKRLSPFAAVDTLAHLGALSPTTGLSGPQGGTVTAPQVLVSTPNDVPMAGITVTLTVTGGGGKLTAVGDNSPVTSVVTTTDAEGKATVGSWILGTGTNTVTAVATPPHLNSGIDPAAGLTFTATALPPVKLAFGTQPVTTAAGSLFTVTVLVQDVQGNTVPASSATIGLALNAGGNGAVLGGAASVAAVNGVATFSGLSITKAGTNYTLSATSAPLTAATSNAFSITAGSASAITINGGDNQTAANGSILGTTSGTTAPSVKVTDQHGNPISGAGVTFQVASGGGSVSPASANTNASGIASTTWTIVTGTNTMSASITALGAVPSVLFTATGTTTDKTLLDCRPSPGSGDDVAFPFYAKRPGKTLKQVTVYMSANDPANVPTPYTIQLIVGAESYGSTLATSTQTVLLNGASSQNLPVNFTFPNTSLGTATNTTFRFNVISNPDGARLTYNTGPCGLGNTKCNSLPAACGTVTETTSTTPLPLSTFRRKGVAVKLIGT